MEPETNREGIANFAETESEKFYNPHMLVGFIDSSIFFHRNRYQLVICSNYAFIDKFFICYMKISAMKKTL